jgi:hypothetical protein
VLFPHASWAGVNIAASCRVKNRPPGRCGWCALETLARYHHLKALYGLARKHPSRCCPESLEDALDGTGIRYRIQYPGSDGLGILHYAIREDLGAVVGFRERYPGSGGHIVTLVDLTETTARVIDSNDQDGRTRTMRRKDFLFWWDGFALVLEPRSRDAGLDRTDARTAGGHTAYFAGGHKSFRGSSRTVPSVSGANSRSGPKATGLAAGATLALSV